MRRLAHKRAGYSRLEITLTLFALGVGGIFFSVPIVKSRETARVNACKMNLKQFGLALHNYHDNYNMFPIGGTGWQNPKVGWHVRIIPFAD